MPQNAARMPASGRQIQNDSPKFVRQQRIGIGADRIEGDVAEIEQAGEADHDVQPPAQHHIGQHHDAEIEQVAVAVEQHRHQQRENKQRRTGQPAERRCQSGSRAGGMAARRRIGSRPNSSARTNASGEHHADQDRECREIAW